MGLKAILTCSCGGMDKQAYTSFAILFPDTPQPVLYKGKDAVRKLADTTALLAQGTNLERYLRGVARQSGRWAYYLEADEMGNITQLHDLLTNRRVA